MDAAELVQRIHDVFDDNVFPGERLLQGSYEGAEPYEEVGPFQQLTDWKTIDAQFLDGHYNALSFFSEAGFRYYLPAFLIADVQDRLETADPLFHLTHGFYDFEIQVPTSRGNFVRKAGKTQYVNPRRYGAMTTMDYARYRLSIFTREEATALVAYLRYKYEKDNDGIERPRIQAALDLFWLDREQHAPAASRLKQYLEDEQTYLAAVLADHPELNIPPS